jgi:protein-S-isoprenylcysteine O-methyltransferase Ste14
MLASVIIAELFFFATAFVLRSILHYRRTGSIGFRGISGHVGSIEWWGGILFGLAIVCLALVPVVHARGLLQPWKMLGTPVWRLVGLIVYVLGLGGTLWAQAAMADSWRIGVAGTERTRMIVQGPFQYVRNPIFTCMTLAVIGITLLLPNAMALLGVLLLIAAVEIQVRTVEEPYLANAHGEAYRRYCSAVGRFVPGIGRLPHRPTLVPR